MPHIKEMMAASPYLNDEGVKAFLKQAGVDFRGVNENALCSAAKATLRNKRNNFSKALLKAFFKENNIPTFESPTHMQKETVQAAVRELNIMKDDLEGEHLMMKLMTDAGFAKAFAKSVDSYVGVKTAVTLAFATSVMVFRLDFWRESPALNHDDAIDVQVKKGMSIALTKISSEIANAFGLVDWEEEEQEEDEEEQEEDEEDQEEEEEEEDEEEQGPRDKKRKRVFNDSNEDDGDSGSSSRKKVSNNSNSKKVSSNSSSKKVSNSNSSSNSSSSSSSSNSSSSSSSSNSSSSSSRKKVSNSNSNSSNSSKVTMHSVFGQDMEVDVPQGRSQSKTPSTPKTPLSTKTLPPKTLSTKTTSTTKTLPPKTPSTKTPSTKTPSTKTPSTKTPPAHKSMHENVNQDSEDDFY